VPALTVKDLMTTDVTTLPAQTPLREAAQVMRTRDIGDVVVADDDKLIGLVTDRDIVVRAIADGADAETTVVGSIVSTELVTVRPEDSAADAARLMRDRAVRRVLVVDEAGGLAGILSIGDLAADIDPDSVLGGISSAEPNN
jgi:CBS domain-containing protein